MKSQAIVVLSACLCIIGLKPCLTNDILAFNPLTSESIPVIDMNKAEIDLNTTNSPSQDQDNSSIPIIQPNQTDSYSPLLTNNTFNETKTENKMDMSNSTKYITDDGVGSDNSTVRDNGKNSTENLNSYEESHGISSYLEKDVKPNATDENLQFHSDNASVLGYNFNDGNSRKRSPQLRNGNLAIKNGRLNVENRMYNRMWSRSFLSEKKDEKLSQDMKVDVESCAHYLERSSCKSTEVLLVKSLEAGSSIEASGNMSSTNYTIELMDQKGNLIFSLSVDFTAQRVSVTNAPSINNKTNEEELTNKYSFPIEGYFGPLKYGNFKNFAFSTLFIGANFTSLTINSQAFKPISFAYNATENGIMSIKVIGLSEPNISYIPSSPSQDCSVTDVFESYYCYGKRIRTYEGFPVNAHLFVHIPETNSSHIIINMRSKTGKIMLRFFADENGPYISEGDELNLVGPIAGRKPYNVFGKEGFAIKILSAGKMLQITVNEYIKFPLMATGDDFLGFVDVEGIDNVAFSMLLKESDCTIEFPFNATRVCDSTGIAFKNSMVSLQKVKDEDIDRGFQVTSIHGMPIGSKVTSVNEFHYPGDNSWSLDFSVKDVFGNNELIGSYAISQSYFVRKSIVNGHEDPLAYNGYNDFQSYHKGTIPKTGINKNIVTNSIMFAGGQYLQKINGFALPAFMNWRTRFSIPLVTATGIGIKSSRTIYEPPYFGCNISPDDDELIPTTCVNQTQLCFDAPQNFTQPIGSEYLFSLRPWTKFNGQTSLLFELATDSSTLLHVNVRYNDMEGKVIVLNTHYGEWLVEERHDVPFPYPSSTNDLQKGSWVLRVRDLGTKYAIWLQGFKLPDYIKRLNEPVKCARIPDSSDGVIHFEPYGGLS